MLRACLLSTLIVLCGCAHGSGTEKEEAAPCPYADADDGTQSHDILCREPITVHAKVKHILVGWKTLATPEHPVDPRAAERTQAQAQQLARQLLQRLRAGEPIEPLMAEFSEDPGSASAGRYYEASPDAGLVPGFKALAVRLKVGEAGIVQSPFGLHVIQRVP